MTPQNGSSLGFQLLVIFLWLLSSSLFQRGLNVLIDEHRWSPFAARKIAHVAVGFWVLPLAFYVPDWYLAAIPIAMILAANTQANLKRGDLTALERRLFPMVAFLAPLAFCVYLWREQRTDVVVLSRSYDERRGHSRRIGRNPIWETQNSLGWKNDPRGCSEFSLFLAHTCVGWAGLLSNADQTLSAAGRRRFYFRSRGPGGMG